MAKGCTGVFLDTVETNKNSAEALNMHPVILTLASQHALLGLNEFSRDFVHLHGTHCIPQGIDVDGLDLSSAAIHVEHGKVACVGDV